ncbi:MAG: 4-alpha-glucanotransferase [Puniceicoccales bacterium]|jgi:4-alpha-glucanotransferase|nr:4-alpha-glucanotransferase [Puniceicoccales bacterium]
MSKPLFTGFKGRHAGVLLHPTALPSRQGAGTLGNEAHAFVDFVADCGLGWWQVCPLGPTGYGDSPYQSFSVFAGNPYLLDLETLKDASLLVENDLAALRALPSKHVDFGLLWEHFHPVLKKAWCAAKNAPTRLAAFGDMRAFRKKNAAWLEDFALFTALKKHFDGTPWQNWPDNARDHHNAIATHWPQSVKEDADAIVFQQFLFFAQWQALRAYATTRHVRIIGDTPIFVAMDSADAWAHPSLFQLDARGRPTHVAGVPPDYFSQDGQLWGNPLYNWEQMRNNGYHWWLQRLRAAFEMFDAVRIDHFRGFHDYWSIPAGATARAGQWCAGPGLDFFKTVAATLGDVLLIAEDLGELNDGVHALRKATGLPGMAVLQFAFGGDASNLYLPHNHTQDCVVYPGTHDNNTALGWYTEATENERDHFRIYLGTDGNTPHWDFIRAAFTSPATSAIIPLQDILGKDATARFNIPGKVGGNWQWRLTLEELAHAHTFLAPTLRKLAQATGRL